MAPDPTPVRARVGLIIPSSNRLTEPQFHRYAPEGVQFHVTRLRMTGTYHLELEELLPRVAEASELLADAACDLIVFHCTANSMESGLQAEQQIVETVRQASGRLAASTASAAGEAFRALGARRLVLVTPYPQRVNQRECEFLAELGLEVIGDRALALGGSDEYLAAPPSLWLDVTREAADRRAEAYFLSCTNVHSIGIIEQLEAALDRPVVTSNQATLWYSLQACGLSDRPPGLGRLMKLPLGLPVAPGGEALPGRSRAAPSGSRRS
jgi:maleate isomerase